MKQLFSVTVLALSLSAAWGQSTTHISNLSLATGATPAITFDVSWTTPPSATPSHRDSIWLFADYRTVNTDGTTGAWTPASITAATITSGAGTLIISTLPGRGFFLDGHGLTTLNTTIRVTLDAPANERFNACVYASDWPPNATLNAGGGYTLKGSPPFIINGTITEPSRTFGAGTCVTSITDATGHPGIVYTQTFSAGAIATTGETVCAGGTPTTIISITPFTGGDNTATYLWYKNGELISGATGENYTPPASDAATAGTYVYMRMANDQTCNVTPIASTGSWILKVEADPTLTVASAQMVCSGATPAAMTATPSGGTGTVSYQWYSGNSAAAATTSISSATANTYAPGALTTTTYYTAVASFTGSGCNAATATAIAKTVHANFSPGAIATTGQTICTGGTPTVIGNTTNASGGDGSYIYEWRLGGTAIGSSNSAAWTPTAQSATTGSHTYTRWVKDGTCNTSFTQSAGSWVLTVIADPSVVIAAAQTICYNTTPAAMTATVSGGTGTVSYQWYSGNSAAAATTSIGGATTSTYAPGALTATTYYTAVASFTGSGCNAATATAIAKTVHANFSPGTISSTGQTICEGGTPVAIGSTTDAYGGDGTYTYEWKLNDNAIASSNAITWTPTAQSATTGSHTYTRWVKDGTCNTTATQSAGSWVLTVIADPTLTVKNAQTICSGKTPAAMTATPSSGTGNITYQWYSGTSVAAVTTSISGATASIYAPGALTTTTYYTAVASFTGSGCNAATATPIAKTVNAVPAITHTGGGASQSVQQGTAITNIVYSASDATIALSNGNFPSGVTGTPSGISYTISGTPSATGTFGYTVRATGITGGCTATSSGTITVTACTYCAIFTACSFTMITNENPEVLASAHDYFCGDTYGSGWRLPTMIELECMCDNKNSLPGGYETSIYASSEKGVPYTYSYARVVNFSDCSKPSPGFYSYYVKCVK
jgi:hypothetical protein